MTFSILAHDAKTGMLGGAAATGSLCVGGWVLRGHALAGMSASQGTAPSTLWGDGALARMRAGESAGTAVQALVAADDGRDYRQLSALDRQGGTGAFTGAHSVPAAGTRQREGLVVAGNLLASEVVLDAVAEGYLREDAPFAERLMAALWAGAAAGSDSRGLQSAALLVVSPRSPPLTLRVDLSDQPLVALQTLYERSQSQPYAGWCDVVPTEEEPHRAPQPDELRVVAEQASGKA